MHLRTLTLRGFKSFASATTLNFEPGVTCVVGPNGSGKSNVVDALAWVMGEQGAKSLRGGKMEDVIFAGTAGRPPLGRAEVSLTIDNTDGALPIDYSEVTISRTLFRNGGSEYAINGTSCRLLDIQDLLSDSGLGREMHVIVGQGQLDAILRATPEERRGFIEEAAGVLKHRKRKEKALRKLDAMAANLTRLADLTTEIRRQLGPLGRQAEVARRASQIQVEVRDAKARLLADDLAQLTANLEQEIADETALRQAQQETETALTQARNRLAELEQQAGELAPQLSRTSEIWYRLSSLRERLRGLHSLASDRARLLVEEAPAPAGQDPDDLQAQAERTAQAEAELQQEVIEFSADLERIIGERKQAEDLAAQAEQHLATLIRAEADRREGLATLTGQVAACRSKVEAADAEVGRLREALEQATTRSHTARQEFITLETQVVGAEEGEEGLDAAHEQAVADLDAATARLEELQRHQSQARSQVELWAAKAETLELSLTRKDAVGDLLASGSSDILGSLAALVAIEPGYEDAISAALGELAEGVAVPSAEHAITVLRQLREQDAGRAHLIFPAPGAGLPGTAKISLPDAAIWATEVVTSQSATAPPIAALLADHVIVEDLIQARKLIAAHPQLVAVTKAGEVLGKHRASGGSFGAPGSLHLQAAYEEANAAAAQAQQRQDQVTFELVAAREAHEVAQAEYHATLERLNESDAALTAVAEQLGHLGAAARAADEEAERLAQRISQGELNRDAEAQRLAELTARLGAAQSEPEQGLDNQQAAQQQRDETAAQATLLRNQETDARLKLRTVEERARALAARTQALESAAQAEREARQRAARRHQERLNQARRAQVVQQAAQQAMAELEVRIEQVGQSRQAFELQRGELEAELARQRAVNDELGSKLRELTDVAHRDELARAQQQLRIEQLQERIINELGTDPQVLMEEFGPHQPVPVLGEDGQPQLQDGEPVTMPYNRAEQDKRLRTAERSLGLLGKVNPLALEEYAALEERHKFLTEQLGDLKSSRDDLLQIVREIDAKVEQVFTAAYHDTAAQFEQIFPRLFPGGEGRMLLTDPQDMLTTGIDVEARPAGKKVKRLSLLSGGERSLVAVAMLVAIFKARPSPFYVMDEVEAALDDANLGRLLEIFTELRDNSQLIIITHQKRTMEIADALYGVSMRGDGVTAVISQRLANET